MEEVKKDLDKQIEKLNLDKQIEKLIFLNLKNFYTENKDIFDLVIPFQSWDVNCNEILFKTNSNIKSKVSFGVKYYEVIKLGHYFLPTTLKKTCEKQSYRNSPVIEKHGEYKFPSRKKGKKLFESLEHLKESIYEDVNQLMEDLQKQNNKEENQRLQELQISQTNVLSELDKDGNGEVDVIEGNDFNLLLKKHQKVIVEIDRTYVQQFVKISSYLKTKEKNIQSIFNSIKDTPNQEVLNEYIEVLKDDIHSYNLILFNSLSMIVTLVEDDMITFYEIHEMFDTLNMFDSKHEKDVSQKLTNIGDGLKDLMYEIRNMGNQISDSIGELTYVTEQSNEQLSNQLSEIDSTMKVGNLINTINTYQNYKNNKNTKNLRG